MDDLRKPWLVPLTFLSTIVLTVAFIGLVGSIGYVINAPAKEGVAEINPFSGRVMHPKENKFKTEPLSWAAIGFGIIGAGAGIAREWARAEKRRIDTQLERMGIFPPPSKGFFHRLMGGG